MASNYATIARKVGGSIIIALSIIFFVACIGGIIGDWVLRSAILTEVRQVATQVSDLISSVDGSVAQVEARLTTTLQRTEAIRARAGQYAERDLSDTLANSLLASLTAMIAEELAPSIERVSEAVDNVVERINSLNQAIRLANRFPGVDLPTLTLSEFLEITEGITAARNEVAVMRNRVAERRIEVRQEVAADVTRLTESIDRLIQPNVQRIGNVRGRLDALRQRVEGTPQWLDSRWLLPLSFSVTFVLLWLAVGQIALAWAGWLMIRGRLREVLTPSRLLPQPMSTPALTTSPDVTL